MHNKLQKLLLALIGLLLSIFSVAEAQNEQDAYRTELYQTSALPLVNVSTSGGFINVYGHDQNEVKVLMFVRRGNRYLSPSDTDLSDFEILIEQDGNQVTASAEREGTGWTRMFRSDSNISVSFRVYVPTESVVDARTSGGSVSAEDLTNKLNLRTSGGSVTAKNVHGEVDLHTSGGSVNINNLSGNISARTSGGAIRADRIVGNAELRTSGGSITIENSAANVSARTSGGGIRAHFLRFTDDIELRTSGGNIRIELPQSDHFDLELTGSRVQTELRNFTGNSERNKIVGRIGNGGPKISARTSGGSVSLSYF
jgi:DUF4097 and DUF4098 domain-containing protein YvlB